MISTLNCNYPESEGMINLALVAYKRNLAKLQQTTRQNRLEELKPAGGQ